MWKRTTIITLLLSALCSVSAPAQDDDAEKDPFFPAEKKPVAPAQAPGDSDWGRDPFNNPLGNKTAPAQKSGSQAGSGGLTGIIYGKQARLAIIDGEVFHEGSMVGDRKLVDIRRKSVIFMSAGGAYEEVFLSDFSLGK
ncbi:MAG TPA: hypothetical protein VI956_05820 [Nitrospirota bacterium]|jgi:hypothetical protein|nr:hypothetical protein [Nitrospirota bacterium]